MGKRHGWVRPLDGPGRREMPGCRMGRAAGTCQAVGWAGLPEDANLPDRSDCQGIPGGRVGQTPGKCQGAGSSIVAGASRVVGLAGLPDGPESRGAPGTRTGATAGRRPAASWSKQPDWTGCRGGQTSGWVRSPSGPASRNMPNGWMRQTAGRCRDRSSLKGRNGPGRTAGQLNGPGREAWNRTGKDAGLRPPNGPGGLAKKR